MRKQLIRNRGERFDIHLETDIGRVINSMVQRQKNGNAAEIQEGSKRNRTSVVYRIAIDDMLSISEFNLSPSSAVHMLRCKFMTGNSLPEIFPADRQIKSRVSTQKSRHKRETNLPEDETAGILYEGAFTGYELQSCNCHEHFRT